MAAMRERITIDTYELYCELDESRDWHKYSLDQEGKMPCNEDFHRYNGDQTGGVIVAWMAIPEPENQIINGIEYKLVRVS